MATLPKNLRDQLRDTILAAREEAELGVAAALEELGLPETKVPSHLNEEQQKLRRRLRAHGKQVGDTQISERVWDISHLIHECAYEHWHRMLFARFLAENGFLIEPESGLDVDFAHCEEEAKRLGIDPWELASRFAQKMLPGIFRPDDPVLQLRMPAESRNRLTVLLASLPQEVFLADDSFGWVYQFWQAKRKLEVNDSGDKVGADDIAPITQLFTDDYMVEFLLHNTLGAWWTAKRRAEGKSQPIAFAYLRLKEDGTPAAGAFEGWVKTVKELRVLDPCMGSGHFLVVALVILVKMRMEEEGLSAADACVAVLRDNLFGLELDPRCTQIAAFNLALAAWKLGSYQSLPTLNLACSGLGLNTKKEEWLKLAELAAETNALAPESDLLGAREETLLSQKLKAGMERLYQLFQKAPVLGSLINPRSLGGDLLMAEFHDLQPVLAKALQRESGDEAQELAITAQGVARAAEILASQFTLVATNVPYLARTRHPPELCDYADRVCPHARTDLATVFITRCLEFARASGTIALVTPQNWNFQDQYETFRDWLLRHASLQANIQLGPGAFDAISGEVVKPALVIASRTRPLDSQKFVAGDLSACGGASEKAIALIESSFAALLQKEQLKNPRTRVLVTELARLPLLNSAAGFHNGICSGDLLRFTRCFWELANVSEGWATQQTTTDETRPFGGMHNVFWWQEGKGDFYRFACERLETDNPGAWIRGKGAWNKRGVLVSAMGSLQVSRYLGDLFDDNTVALVPLDQRFLPALWAFCSSEQYAPAVRQIDQSLKVRGPLVEVPFSQKEWEEVAAEKYPGGLPKPFSSDPTQWLFNGHPKDSDHPLQVAVARLVGYRWPRQTGSSFPDCPTLEPDGLEKHADNDGVVCFSQARDEAPAATRLRALLADAYGKEWGHAMERKLIAATGSTAESLEDWLVNDFFAQHCDLFHSRPFVWHIWDGRKDGFNLLVNYHKLAGPKGEGYRTLETLTYAYLGDWIGRQKDSVAHGEAGSDDRLAAANELQGELKKIVAGEPPYDLFVRWKPLHHQPEGWHPDINDGVRMNIRPFMVATLSRGKKGCGLFRAKPGNSVKWDKDRGKEPSRPKNDFPWFWSWDEQTENFTGNGEFDGNRWTDCHYTTAFKRAAREKKKS